MSDASPAPSESAPAVVIVDDTVPQIDLAALQTANARRVRLQDLARSNPMIRDLLADHDRAMLAGEQTAADLATARASLESSGRRIHDLETELKETREKLQAALSKPAAGKPSGGKPAAAPAPAAPAGGESATA